MPNPTFTITVTVDTSTVPPTLKTDAGVGGGGGAIATDRHQVFRGSDLSFICPDGDLLIQFKGQERPFKRPSDRENVIVSAASGVGTPALTTKNSAWGPRTRYTAVVARPVGPPFLVFKDPELEDGGDPGGKKPKGKTAKKAAKKKNKK